MNFTVKKIILTTAIAIGALFPSLPASAQNSTEGQRFYPSLLLKTDAFFTHHTLVAEKSTHSLHIFRNNEGKPELVKSFQMATGKKMGDKLIEGDFKTPEGIYHFTDFLTNKQLLRQSGPMAEMYGAGAFVMNYPNPVDRLLKKTGSGIWLHSTNDETRIDKGLDSRGCVVTANNELIEISRYIELDKTPIIVVQDLHYTNEKTHSKHLEELEKAFNGWLEAWRNKDINTYMSYYHPEEFSDRKGKFNQYKVYKRAVFSMPGTPTINVEHLSILKVRNYAVITFIQNYQSNTINDAGKKILYLRQDQNHDWKIVNETWTKHGLDNLNSIAFEPTLRFFKEGTREGIEITKGNPQ